MDSAAMGKKREYIFNKRSRQLVHLVVTCAATDEEHWPAASVLDKFGGAGDMRAILKLLDMKRASQKCISDDNRNYLPIKNENNWKPLLSLKK
jgi:hypothetical protein